MIRLFTIVILFLGCGLQSSLDAQFKGNDAACGLSANQKRLVASQRDDLWGIVQHSCQSRGSVCFDHSIIVKDIKPEDPEAYLLIPLPLHVDGYEMLQRVTGVECTLVTKKPVSDMWNEAWIWASGPKLILPKDNSRYFANVSQKTSKIGLAANSMQQRSEGQLHIHISCVKPEIADALKKDGFNVGFGIEFPVPSLSSAKLADSATYKAVKVTKLTDADSPFRVVSDVLQHKNNMDSQGIAVIPIGESGEGFYVLDTTYQGHGVGGFAEELLDQYCGGES